MNLKDKKINTFKPMAFSKVLKIYDVNSEAEFFKLLKENLNSFNKDFLNINTKRGFSLLKFWR